MPWARACGLIPSPGSSPHAVPLIGPAPGFDPDYALTTDLDDPVIIASITAAGSGPPAPLLIDGYALPVVVQVEVTASERPWPGALEGARPRLVHLRLGPACLLSRMVWGKCPC
jgi:hypothetical protein